MKPLVLALAGNEKLGLSLTEQLDGELGAMELRHFPDGETYIRIDSAIEGRIVILVCSLDRPDAKILPLILSSATARDLGAASVGFVLPYLAYMRQDRRFHPGEGITSAYFAKLLSSWADWLVTVDPHLHRRSSLSDIYTIPAFSLQAAPLVSAWITDRVENPVLVGPDSESEQWVASVAKDAGAPYVILEKERLGDRDVKVSVPDTANWQGHTPVLVDDIISTGKTMIETVGHLRDEGLPPAICIGVHGIFAGNAFQELIDAGVGRVVTSNSIPHASNEIDLSALISVAIKERSLAQQSTVA